MSAAKRYLAGINSSPDSDRGFDRYWKAFSEPVNRFDDGHVVATLIVTCITDFSMKGLDEPTVTNGLGPVIPGSTIKGFFRHKLNREKPIKIIDHFGGLTNGAGSSYQMPGMLVKKELGMSIYRSDQRS